MATPISSPYAVNLAQATYLRWLQSPLLTLLVGVDCRVFSLPTDLLVRRSPYFHGILQSPGREAVEHTIRLPETDPDLFAHVMLWLMAPYPSLSPEPAFPLALSLAIWATQHEVPALLNQLLDRLRTLFTTSNPPTWSPDLLDHLYASTPSECSLRRWAVYTLAIIGRSGDLFSNTPKPHCKLWQPLFEAYPALGYEYFVAKASGYRPEDLSNLPTCCFHHHIRQPIQNILPARITFSRPPCAAMALEPFEDMTQNVPPPGDPAPTKLSKSQKRKAKRQSEAADWWSTSNVEDDQVLLESTDAPFASAEGLEGEIS